VPGRPRLMVGLLDIRKSSRHITTGDADLLAPTRTTPGPALNTRPEARASPARVPGRDRVGWGWPNLVTFWPSLTCEVFLFLFIFSGKGTGTGRRQARTAGDETSA
jgi:hypothetical protein